MSFKGPEFDDLFSYSGSEVVTEETDSKSETVSTLSEENDLAEDSDGSENDRKFWNLIYNRIIKEGPESPDFTEDDESISEVKEPKVVEIFEKNIENPHISEENSGNIIVKKRGKEDWYAEREARAQSSYAERCAMNEMLVKMARPFNAIIPSPLPIITKDFFLNDSEDAFISTFSESRSHDESSSEDNNIDMGAFDSFSSDNRFLADYVLSDLNTDENPCFSVANRDTSKFSGSNAERNVFDAKSNKPTQVPEMNKENNENIRQIDDVIGIEECNADDIEVVFEEETFGEWVDSFIEIRDNE